MSRLLYQLSYTAQNPKRKSKNLDLGVQGRLAPLAGVWGPGPQDNSERARLVLSTSRPRLLASPLTESNRRPSPYHGDALPTELTGPILGCLTWGFVPTARFLGRVQRWYSVYFRPCG